MDFKGQGVKIQDWALASLSVMAKLDKVISVEMLQSALKIRFKGKDLVSALDLIGRVQAGDGFEAR